MHSELRAQVAFRLTGLRSPVGETPPADARSLRPALTARLRNLAALRYDFPIVAFDEPVDGEFAVPLSTLLDRLLDKVVPADADDGTEIRKSALRLEREIRGLLAHGASGSLQALWDLAASRLGLRSDPAQAKGLDRVRKALTVEGNLLDCDAGFPGEFILRAWKAVQKRKAERFHDEIHRLIVRLSEILAADEARSPVGRTPERLRDAFGTVHRDAFDFEAMSRLVARAGGTGPLGESRRQRVRSLLIALESQRFFLDDSGFTFTFDRCGLALRTFRARYERMRSLARSLAMARLEVAGEYDEARHDALFQQIRQSPLTLDEIVGFPDYLVRIREHELDAAARAELLEMLASGMPVKVLVQTDDLLEDLASVESLAGVASRSDAMTGMALGLDNVFVLQSAASNLYRVSAGVIQAMEYAGPAFVSVFSGATGDSACLPPYLNAAAAMESRAFPAFSYDPRKPLEGGSRFCLENNPQPDRAWPVHTFEFEDATHQAAREELRFTVADFVAGDERFARHFLAADGGKQVPLADWLEGGAPDDDASPVIAMTDEADGLHRVVVDEAIAALAKRSLDRWQRLQKLAAMGFAPPPAPAVEAEPAPEAASRAEAAPSLAAPAATAESAKAPSSDEAYIETPRCTTCNECTQLNSRMFAYDANKQAYIADITAGTYRQLVEAAESCQVSIIHPGKPVNPDEPGLDELLERAAAFR